MLGETVWPDGAGDAPDVFTEAWVTSTLTAAGYSWNGTQWVRS